MVHLLESVPDKITTADTSLALCLDRALNNISQGLCFFDGSHRLIICNNRYIDMYGLSAEAVRPGVSLRDIVEMRVQAGTGPVMSKERYIAWRDAIAVSDTPHDTIVELQNGRIINVRHRPMPDGGWVATHEDVTETKRQESSFRLLFRSNPIPMWVLDPATLRFLDVNDAAAVHYGFSRERFLAMTADEVRFSDDVHNFRLLIASGENSQGTRTWRHRRADGQAIFVIVYAENLEFDGKTARLCAIIDVTDRKLSEAKLFEQKLQIDAAVDNMSQGLVMFDPDGRIVVLNRRYMEMYGLSPKVVRLGCTLRQLIEHRKEVGLFRGDPEAYCAEIVQTIRSGKTLTKLIESP